MSTNRKLLSGALGGFMLTGVNMAVSFIQFSFLLRKLPLEMAGIWLVFTNFATYVMFLDMGLTPTLGREVSFATANPSLSSAARAERIDTLIRSFTTVSAFLVPFVVLVGTTGGWAYLRTIVPPNLGPQARAGWFIFIFGAAINLLGEGWFAGIFGLGQVFTEKIIRCVSALLGFVFMMVALFAHTGFVGLAVAYLLQSVCSILMARVSLRRLTSHTVGEGRFDFQVIRELIGPSLKYAATFLGVILILQTDNVVIASTLGPKMVPNYQAVAKMITVLMGLSMMLVMTSMPLASQAYARGDGQAMLQLLSKNLRSSLGIMVISGSFLACFADRVIAVWLGPNHFVGFPVVWVLLAVMLLEAHQQPMAAATMSTGNLAFVAPALMAGVLNLFFSIVLAKRYGLIGVVLGTTIAEVLTNDWYVPWYTLRLFKISFLEHTRSVIIRVLCLIVVMLITGGLARILTSRLPGMLSLIAGAACMAAVGIVASVGIMLTSRERRTVIGKFLRWVQVGRDSLHRMNQ